MINKLKRVSIKKRGSMLASTIIIISATSVIAGSIIFATQNIINYSNTQKNNLYINNTLVSEIEEYKAINFEEIQNLDYTKNINNKNANIKVNLINEDNNYKEFEIIVKIDELEKKETLIRYK